MRGGGPEEVIESVSLWLLFGGLVIAVVMVIAVGGRNARPGWWRRDRLLLVGLALLTAGAIGVASGFGIPLHEERIDTATAVVVAAAASAILVGLWMLLTASLRPHGE